MLNKFLCVFPWKMRRAHRPKAVGHIHAILGRAEEILDSMLFPTTVKCGSNPCRIALNVLLPMRHIGLIICELSHFDHHVSDFIMIHGEATEALFK